MYGSRANSRYLSTFRNQSSLLLCCFAIGCGAIVARLTYLQIISGPKNRMIAYENRTRSILRPPIRGRLLDRKGIVLATSSLKYNLYINPKTFNSPEWPRVRHQLSELLNLSPDKVEEYCNEEFKKNDYRLNVAKNLSTKQVMNFFERRKDFKGIELDIETLRSYPHGSLAAHVMGYTSTLRREEYAKLKTEGYRIDDRIGRSGIERAYESTLRGSWGGQKLEVNALGKVQRRLENNVPTAGADLQLTLDFRLQKAAEEALRKVKKGAVVAMDAQTGAIRAMASHPSFDPNIFSPAPSIRQWETLDSVRAPLVNRALRGFPPASTFKVVSTIAALESGKYNTDSKILSTRSFCFEGQCYHDHVSLGLIDFPTALAISSNTVYYRVGLAVGSTELLKASEQMGYGSETGVELVFEESKGSAGRKKGSEQDPSNSGNWSSVDTIVSAIGQGVLEVTPLQMARLYAAIGNGGWLVTPHLVEKPTVREAVGLKLETLQVLHKGLRKVVTEGTATLLNDSSLPSVAGKTGTAENPPYADHTWFAGYAPEKKPNLVVVVFCENSGGFGGTVAAPIAKILLRTWFQET
uniref:beta-lactamase n=1 Tax=Paulinella micropora TaxID=1928728 RepID=A0A1L5YBZ0_9EUKA|nr:putative penicillin-binding protein [Paulinella micropora]AQX44978.1 putative penicillin-binding protein [Paulinella micropora]